MIPYDCQLPLHSLIACRFPHCRLPRIPCDSLGLPIPVFPTFPIPCDSLHIPAFPLRFPAIADCLGLPIACVSRFPAIASDCRFPVIASNSRFPCNNKRNLQESWLGGGRTRI